MILVISNARAMSASRAKAMNAQPATRVISNARAIRAKLATVANQIVLCVICAICAIHQAEI